MVGSSVPSAGTGPNEQNTVPSVGPYALNTRSAPVSRYVRSTSLRRSASPPNTTERTFGGSAPASSSPFMTEGTMFRWVIRSAYRLSASCTALSTRTREPPRQSALKISITDMSKQTELAAATPLRSQPSRTRSISASIATQPACRTATPLGVPVEPEV